MIDDAKRLPGFYETASPGDTRWLTEDESLPEHELLETHRRLKALCLLAQDMRGCEDYKGVLVRTGTFLSRLLCADRCVMTVLSPEGDLLADHVDGFDGDHHLGDAHVSSNIVRQVCEKHIAVLSTDAQEDRDLKCFESVSALSIRSVLCVPLGSPEVRRGFIYLDTRMRTGVFTRRDLLFLTAVCRLLDGAVEVVDRRQEQDERARRDAERIKALQDELYSAHKIVGRSKTLTRAYDRLKRIASRTDVPILLRGESGTGKELFARAAHECSPFHAGPFIAASLVATPLVESELFGHEKGAFTDAKEQRDGLLLRADGGTLFLDEIADISSGVQAKLLRVLEERTFCRVGGNTMLHSAFRLVVATSRDLEKMVSEGSFREDLYHRLAGTTVLLPPLRERPEDIPGIVEFVLRQKALKKRFSASAIRYLQTLPWPGNVRQLWNAVCVACAFSEGDVVRVEDVREAAGDDVYEAGAGDSADGKVLRSLDSVLDEATWRHMSRALALAGGTQADAAALIGVAPSTFSEKFRRLKSRYRVE